MQVVALILCLLLYKGSCCACRAGVVTTLRRARACAARRHALSSRNTSRRRPLKKLALVPRFDPLRIPARTPCVPPSPSPAPRPPPPELSLSCTTQVGTRALQNKDAIMIEGCPCPLPGIQFGKHKATTAVQKEREEDDARKKKSASKSKKEPTALPILSWSPTEVLR